MSANNINTSYQPTLWVIDDDQSIRWVLEKTFQSAQWHIRCFDNANSALDVLEAPGEAAPDVILSDIRMPGMNGLVFLTELKKTHPTLPVIVMTAHSDLDAAVSSFQTGAFEYLPKPFDIDEVVNMVNRALAFSQSESALQPQVNTKKGKSSIIGKSPAMQEVFRIIGRLSQSPISVLINGESGTGKELVAQALHQNSPRKDKPFIALNMAAIPKDLIESELFGHEKGAFTGANASRIGRFEQATGGTLFLDEIGDMPFEAQTRLLRVLAEGEFYRVGGQIPVKVDVRIIAATHQNLEDLVQQKSFREDLFHRINVIRIQIPPLRARTEDIADLADYFLQLASKELGTNRKVLSDEALAVLEKQPWSGNVRQLENVCRWLTVMASSSKVLPADLPVEMQASLADADVSLLEAATLPKKPAIAPAALNHQQDMANITWQALLAQWASQKLQQGDHAIMDEAQAIFDKILIETALKHTNGQRNLAAEKLGLGRNTLTRKAQQLGLDE